MKAFRLAVIPLVIASSFNAAQAAGGLYDVYVAPMASYVLADDDRHSDDGKGGTLAIGFLMTESFAFEVRGTYLNYGKSSPDNCGGALQPACKYADKNAIAGGAGFNLYLAGGGSGPYLHGDVLAGKDTMYNAGVGWDLNVYHSIALRAEALYHVQYDTRATGETYQEPQFNLGLRIPLGSPPPPPPPPAPEPVAVVPVVTPPPQCSDGIDNDGDGFIDYPADKGCTDANDNDEYNPICKAPLAGEKISLDGCGVGDTIVLQGVTFEFDKARLTPNAKVILDGVAEALTARPDIKVELGGHTDSRGKPPYNVKLSDRRAESVKKYLETKGIAADRLTWKGYGETMPVADNATDEGRELNRRVELKVTESNGAVTVAPTVRTAEGSEPMAPVAPVEAAPAAAPVAAEPAPAPAPAAEPAPAPAAAAGGNTVTISNFAFAPTSLTVPVGTTVTWINKDGSNHFVAFADSKSPRLKEDATYTKTFTTPGTYAYACTLHPAMTGTIIVQ